MTACAGDLGNYDYHALTEPVITGIETDLAVLTHARLELRPDLGENDFPASDYAFEWRALSQNDNPTMTLLAETPIWSTTWSCCRGVICCCSG